METTSQRFVILGKLAIAMEENEPGQHLPYPVLSDRGTTTSRDEHVAEEFFTSSTLARPAMAKVASSPLTVSSAAAAAAFALQQPPSSSKTGVSLYRSRIAGKRARISAKLGGDGELKPQGKKKFITKEEEPEQYWQTAGERKGENPMMTPLPYIIIFGMSTPFVILAIAFANGWVKVPVR